MSIDVRRVAPDTPAHDVTFCLIALRPSWTRSTLDCTHFSGTHYLLYVMSTIVREINPLPLYDHDDEQEAILEDLSDTPHFQVRRSTTKAPQLYLHACAGRAE